MVKTSTNRARRLARSSGPVSIRTTTRPNPKLASEDEALNQLCDQRLKEPRYPIEKLLKKLGHELES